MKNEEEQAVLIFERKKFRIIQNMVLNMKMGNGKLGRIEN
jgi:hypothetical protein